MANPFPSNVDNYRVEGALEATKPAGANRLLVTLDNTVAMAAGGTGIFYLHPTDPPEARTFDVSAITSIAIYGLASVGLVWSAE